MQTPISPKVAAAGIAGVISTLLLSVVTLITPDLFDGLGKYGPLAYGFTIVAVILLAGYLKGDPLRVSVLPTEGSKPEPEPASVTVNAPATAAEPVAPSAPAVSFAPTQARIDAAAVQLPDVLQQPTAAPTTPAP